MLRDMMLYHSRKFTAAEEQIEQARALINWLSETVAAENNPYGLLLQHELEQMRQWPDTYFRHDSLEEINEPLYFHQFIARAERHELQYLAEAEFSSMLACNYASSIDETLNRLGRDIVEMEQYMDFLRNRMFRQTLLCHRKIRLERSLGPWSLANLHCAAFVRPTDGQLELESNKVTAFRGTNNRTISTSQPVVKAALTCLAELWPASTSLSDLVARARAFLDSNGAASLPERGDVESETDLLAGVLLTLFSRGLCELHAHPGPFVVSPGPRPQACPWVRFQAARGHPVTNRRHEKVVLDAFAKYLLPLLDGQHDRPAVVEALTNLVANGSLVVKTDDHPVCDPQRVRELMSSELDRRLPGLGRSALLIG
jgi:methyltransferase-like protein